MWSVSFDNQLGFETIRVHENTHSCPRAIEKVPSSDTGYRTDAESNISSVDAKVVKSQPQSPRTKNDLIRLYFSGIYLWEVWLVSSSMLCMYYYVSSSDNLITQQSFSHNVLSQYTNACRIIQSFGITFVPVMGPYLDGRWTSRNQINKDNDSKSFDIMKRYATALAVTNSLCVLQKLISLMSILQLQYISMICQVALRGCLYAILFLHCSSDTGIALW